MPFKSTAISFRPRQRGQILVSGLILALALLPAIGAGAPVDAQPRQDPPGPPDCSCEVTTVNGSPTLKNRNGWTGLITASHTPGVITEGQCQGGRCDASSFPCSMPYTLSVSAARLGSASNPATFVHDGQTSDLTETMTGTFTGTQTLSSYFSDGCGDGVDSELIEVKDDQGVTIGIGYIRFECEQCPELKTDA